MIRRINLKKIIAYITKLKFIFLEVFKSNPLFFFISIFSMIMSGISPVIMSYAVSEIINAFDSQLGASYDEPKALALPILLVLSAIITFFTDNVKHLVTDIAGFNLSHNIENIIADKFQKVPQEFMDNPNFLDLYKNTTEQASYGPINIVDNLFTMISNITKLSAYIVIIYTFNFYILVMILFFSVPIYYFNNKIQIKNFMFYKRNTMKFRQKWYYFSLISDKKYSKEIRVLNLFDAIKDKRNKLFGNLLSEKINITKTNVFYSFVTSIFAICSLGVSIFVLINCVKNGSIHISKFVLYSTSVVSLQVGILSLINCIVSGNRNMAFLNYLFDFIKLQTSKKTEKTNQLKISMPLNDLRIEFINVSFKYPNTSFNSLENINFSFSGNNKICLVGENGSGKTTLIKLLLRVYESFEGQIKLNGKDIRTYDIYDYRKLFSIVFQDYIKYSTSVINNIAFGDISRINDIDLIKKSSEITKANVFIDRYKNNYYTNLSKEFYEDGIEPSIGQWQKLALSRAIFRNSPILIFDEPTASLDPKSEEEIFQLLNDFYRSKAILFISHRMYSAKFADQIIMLENGRVIEQGTYNQLINNKKNFFEMYNLQAQRYASKQ